MKTIDVIIPTYNRALYLKRSIDSVLNQTYSNLNVYVIDDNSSDNTEEVMKTISDDRVHYIKLSSNHGANFCRNYGVEISSADYVAFNDSDDVWKNNKLEIQMKYMEEKESFCFCPYLLHDANIKRFVGYWDKSEDLLDVLLMGNIIGTPTLLLTRQLFEKVKGFNNNLRRFQDWEFVLRLANCSKVYYVDEILVDAYRITDGVTITTDDSYAMESIKTIAEANRQVLIERGAVDKWFSSLMNYRVQIQDFDYFFNLFGISLEERVRLLKYLLIDSNNKLIKVNGYYDLVCEKILEWDIDKDLFNGKIAIYGNGKLGTAIARKVEGAGLAVECILDRNIHQYSEYEIETPEVFLKRNNVSEFMIINSVLGVDDYLIATFSMCRIITYKDLTQL